ncbi:MAG: polyhydroxyalkanoate synthesis repressor PhaR [Rhodospirillales bacterium]|nr:polyhydroxyalkanoate synthesis repressor PhaR [Rhodospirillales bacterium]MDP7098849.1 polyhydroxyalkanoate synthesis repressor PhaR [Rhodospirillales bacterium]MDP7215198.1 polyhydroxyalkanoate synthesis repressor PhaR [Rhodospirillales bacterium]HIJ42656.1 polyhydroxyalkanoate synthesis repressor PhaR [Rhodospirillaceae bacterium]HIJ92439.1 polyhydroxyalkanoate synthesis repressor PhaR [Rhodospirillaceae bacterium]
MDDKAGTAGNGAAAPGSAKAPIKIKKYANRRLYNTATSSYVTLVHLARMVRDGTDFVVYDSRTGDDITRAALTQIIVEEEARGRHLLPIDFLRHLISFHGDSLQALVSRYLDHSMHAFARNQEQMRHYTRDAKDGALSFGRLKNMGKQNMADFENAMKTLAPHREGGGRGESKRGNGQEFSGPSKEKLDEFRAKLSQMQKQLDDLTRAGGQS